MNTAHVNSLASELETTLGLLNELVSELQRVKTDWTEGERVREIVTSLSQRSNLQELPAILIKAYAQIAEALGGIRLTREAIHAHAVQRLRDSHHKLNEVSSATESATLEMMNGLDRTLKIIDQLDESWAAGRGHAGAEPGFDHLRTEVNQMFNHLQFQDITAQQLAGVAQFLDDIESRIAGVVSLFDHALGAHLGVAIATTEQSDSRTLAFNPDASMSPTADRQDQIDRAFQANPVGGSSTGPSSTR